MSSLFAEIALIRKKAMGVLSIASFPYIIIKRNIYKGYTFYLHKAKYVITNDENGLLIRNKYNTFIFYLSCLFFINIF